jgi:tetratricopeptide (TPR) repeat protein
MSRGRLARWLAAVALCLACSAPADPARAQTTEADVYVGRAVVLFEEKSYAAALQDLNRALRLEPDHVEALYYAGVIYMALGQPQLAAQVLERARKVSPTDTPVALQLGLAYFGLNQYDKAEPLLEEVFRTEPTLDGVGYYVGFIRYRNKDYQGALRAFREGRTTDPELQQLTRLYTSLTLGVLGLPAQAAAEVEQALRLAPASPLTGPTERLRDAFVSARKREQRYQIEVRLGFLADSNVRVLPEPSHDPTAESLRQKRDRQSSTGEIGAVRLEYAWLRTEQWEGTVAYSFFHTHYNKLASFDVVNHLGVVGGSYRGAVGKMPYQLGLQYSYDFLELDNDEFLQRNTAGLSGTLVHGPVHLTSLQGRFQTKEYSSDQDITPREDRDGRNWMGGFTHIVRFSEEKHFLKLGYQADREDTSGRNFAYVGHRYLTGAQYTLPWWNLRLKYDYDVHFKSYLNRNSTLPERNPWTTKRRDTEQTHSIKAELPLPLGLTVTGEYQGSVARSNLPAFSFNRNVVSLITSWAY